ncbi:MAG: hypothetical protein N3E39_04270 [Candidatus Methanomethylicia archaeon]|nr:hypothetical protein [Candidatus Methanomethylicia archaeon]
MYDEIIEVLKRELASSKLTVIPRDFYINAKIYLKDLKDKISSSSSKDIAEIFEHKFNLIIEMLSLIFELRIYKIVKHMFLNASSMPEGLLDEELDAYIKIKDILQSIIQSFKSSLSSGHIFTKRLLIRFTSNVPAFVGVDLVIYGPFEPEDIAYIPLANAEVLISKGLAERLEG